MTLTRKLGLTGICIAILATAFLIVEARLAFGDVAYQQPGNTNSVGLYKTYNFFATSTNQQIVAGVPFYGTSTPDTVGLTQATSTSIAAWVNASGQLDNGSFVIGGASQVVLTCARQATSTNNGATTCLYQVQTYPKQTWQYFNQLTVVASTSNAVAVTTLVSSLTTTTGATTTLSAVMGNQNFYAVRCIVNITTDGIGLCSASARW